VGFAYCEVGAFAEAKEVLQNVLELGERMEMGAIAALARNNLGRALTYLDELDRAWDLELEAIEAFRIQGDIRLENGSRVYLADLRAKAGDLAHAEREARLAVEQCAEIPTVLAQALGSLAAVLLAAKQPEQALQAAQQAMTVHESIGKIDEGEALIRLALVESLAGCGHEQRARAALRVAVERLRQRAASIKDPHWRSSFLTKVGENARTMKLAADWKIEEKAQ
jgi:tetratricopeptide (TPR) repeat protein